MSETPSCHLFAFAPSARPLLRLIGVRPDPCELRVGDDTLKVRCCQGRLSTWLGNVAAAEVTGPNRSWKVLVPRLSRADRGLTFGINAAVGVCIGFRQPVPGLEPTGRLRHPALPVTVADPQLLVDRVRRHVVTPPDRPAVSPLAARLRRQG